MSLFIQLAGSGENGYESNIADVLIKKSRTDFGFKFRLMNRQEKLKSYFKKQKKHKFLDVTYQLMKKQEEQTRARKQ